MSYKAKCPNCGQQVVIQLKAGWWYFNGHKIKDTNDWCRGDKKVPLNS